MTANARKMVKSKTYESFVEKFKPKLTTDDCYTPEEVYAVVLDWVKRNSVVHFGDAQVVRPFRPGGDYQAEAYDGRVVVDNPPFSILSSIIRWYTEQGVRFFLFAPALTLLSARIPPGAITYVPASVEIEYHNGAKVSTSFVTNLLPAEYCLYNDPGLARGDKGRTAGQASGSAEGIAEDALS